ncbi:MAG TPA: hypothetical protein DCY15_02355 [Ruminococcaceae bacterium]|nr:hypothetical protein [Oscillospiraceae bacterium]
MKKAIVLSCLDGLLRFFTLYLISDLSVSVYTESILSIIAAALLIAVYYAISHFTAKMTSFKNRPVFLILSLVTFLFLTFIWGIMVKFGAAEIHIFPQGTWDTGAGWSAIMLCAMLITASLIERSIMIFVSVYRRKSNEN